MSRGVRPSTVMTPERWDTRTREALVCPCRGPGSPADESPADDSRCLPGALPPAREKGSSALQNLFLIESTLHPATSRAGERLLWHKVNAGQVLPLGRPGHSGLSAEPGQGETSAPAEAALRSLRPGEGNFRLLPFLSECPGAPPARLNSTTSFLRTQRDSRVPGQEQVASGRGYTAATWRGQGGPWVPPARLACLPGRAP